MLFSCSDREKKLKTNFKKIITKGIQPKQIFSITEKFLIVFQNSNNLFRNSNRTNFFCVFEDDEGKILSLNETKKLSH